MPYEEDKLQGIDEGIKPERYGCHAAGRGTGSGTAGGGSKRPSAREAAVRSALPRQRHPGGSA